MNPQLSAQIQPEVSAPMVFEAQIPFELQHGILTKLQGLLERACFQFTQQKLPTVLKMKGWFLSEQVELSEWTDFFKSNTVLFGDTELVKLTKPFNAVMQSLRQLRNTAVHRLPVSAAQFGDFVRDTHSMMQLLDQKFVGDILDEIFEPVATTVDELGKQYQVLEGAFHQIKSSVHERRVKLEALVLKAREELDKEVDKARAEMNAAIKIHLTRAGESLQPVLMNLEQILLPVSTGEAHIEDPDHETEAEEYWKDGPDHNEAKQESHQEESPLAQLESYLGELLPRARKHTESPQPGNVEVALNDEEVVLHGMDSMKQECFSAEDNHEAMDIAPLGCVDEEYENQASFTAVLLSRPMSN